MRWAGEPWRKQRRGTTNRITSLTPATIRLFSEAINHSICSVASRQAPSAHVGVRLDRAAFRSAKGVYPRSAKCQEVPRLTRPLSRMGHLASMQPPSLVEVQDGALYGECLVFSREGITLRGMKGCCRRRVSPMGGSRATSQGRGEGLSGWPLGTVCTRPFRPVAERP